MVEALLELCDRPVADERRISMKKDFPRLHKLAPTRLIIPLQESLTARLSTTSAIVGDYQPFPVDAPVFHRESCPTIIAGFSQGARQNGQTRSSS
jgi:serine/threonine-protein kinase ATR